MSRFAHIAVLLFLFLAFDKLSDAQSISDSLRHVIELSKTDTGKINLIEKFSRTLSDRYPGEIIPFIETGLTLARKNKDKVSEMKLLGYYGDCFYFLNKLDESVIYYKKSLQIANQEYELKQKSKLQNFIGISYYSMEQYDTAAFYYLQSYISGILAADSISAAQAMVNLAIIERLWGKYDSAIVHLNEANRIFRIYDNQNQIAGVCNNIGSILKNMGNYKDAINNYLEAVRIYEKLKNNTGLANTYNKIGIIYYEWGDYEKASEYYNKALELEEKLNNKVGIANALNNIGLVYKQWGNPEKAIHHFEKVFALYEEIPDTKGMANALTNIGDTYYKLGDYEKASDYLSKTLDLEKKLNDKKGIAVSLISLGRILMQTKKYNESEKNLNEALNIARGVKLTEQLKDVYSALYELSYATGKYKLSIEYYLKYTNIKDSIFQIEKLNAFNEISTKYETEKKEKEISRLLNDKLVKENHLKTQEIFRNYLISGILLLIIFLIFFIYRFRAKKKANTRLALYNQEILAQKEEIRAQAEKLEQVNIELEKLSFIAQKTDNSVIITDSLGNIQWANGSFETHFGYSLSDYISKFGENLISALRNKELENALETIRKTHNSIDFISRIITGTKKIIWLQTNITPVFESDNELKGFIAICSDITNIKSAEEEIKKQQFHLKKAFKKSGKQQLKLLIALEQINEQQKEITSSIKYAQQIQKALMPPAKHLENIFEEYFVLLKPKYIVSGDFYWFKQIENKVIFCVADCTGHGVPGAFMSMLGIALITEIVNKYPIDSINSGNILNDLRTTLIQSLHQTGNIEETQDGMDIALCILDSETNNLQFSGANNPLWIVRKLDNLEINQLENGFSSPNLQIEKLTHQLVELKGDRMPVGISFFPGQVNFSVQTIDLNKEDKLYLFSDGFFDQLGGSRGAKIKRHKFRELLTGFQDKKMTEQKKILENYLAEWISHENRYKEAFEQTDDILILGIKI